jgi:hypothetical protein
MTSDLDIYRTASVLIREHGDEATCDVQPVLVSGGAALTLARRVILNLPP